MAKTWQYGRWRGVALQVVMWLIFGSSLGLAAYIDHRRSGALDVALAEPRTFGRLSVRLPKDWSVETRAGPPQALVATHGRRRNERRTLRITQEQPGAGRQGPEDYLETIINIPNIQIEPEPFPFLGQDDAVLVPLRFSLRGRVPEGVDLVGMPEPGLYACAVLPDGLAVTVQVVGEGQYGPSSRRLLRRVADSIRVADTPAATGPTP
jgi:hypothetical protein